MENLEIKERFFAQYWGQLYEFKHTKTKWRVDVGAFPLEKEGNERLLLTDLKNISDEDAINLATLCWNKNIQHQTLENGLKTVQQLTAKYDDGFYGANHIQKAIDFLRSKGYALPFMEYSVNDLVEMGWVKLKS